MGILDELKKEEGKIRITLSLDKNIVEKIDEIREELGFKSRSYTVNKLLGLILQQIEKEKRRNKRRKQKHNPVEHKNKEQEHSLKEQLREQQNKAQFLEQFNPFASLDKIRKK